MRSKTTFLVYCLVGVILLSSACLLVFVRAADQSPSNCVSLLEDYYEKTNDFHTARSSVVRATVAAAKALGTDVPPEWTEYEGEYDSNPNDFVENFIQGVSTHPNMSPIFPNLIRNAMLSKLSAAEKQQMRFTTPP